LATLGGPLANTLKKTSEKIVNLDVVDVYSILPKKNKNTRKNVKKQQPTENQKNTKCQNVS